MIMIIAFEIEILSCKCQNITTWVGESVYVAWTAKSFLRVVWVRVSYYRKIYNFPCMGGTESSAKDLPNLHFKSLENNKSWMMILTENPFEPMKKENS